MQARALVEARVDADRMMLATHSALDADGDLLDARRSAQTSTRLMAALREPPQRRRRAGDRSRHAGAGQRHRSLCRPAHEPRHPASPGRQEHRDGLKPYAHDHRSPCPSSRSFPTPNTARRAPRSRRPAGTSICEALLDNNINIEHACDMSCACTTCHVIVREGFSVAQRAGRERGRPAGPRLGPGAQLAPELPGHPGAEGCDGGDPQVLDQPRQGKSLNAFKPGILTMRQIFLDTETTGLSADNGDRIIEIGCVELLEPQAHRQQPALLREPRARQPRGRAQGARHQQRVPARQAQVCSDGRRAAGLPAAAPRSSSTTRRSTSAS